MANGRDHLSHFLVVGRVANEDFHRPGGGNPRVRPVEDRAEHGRARVSELESALVFGDAARQELLYEKELRALGTIVTLEGGDAAYPLKVDSLQQFSRHRKTPRRPKWLLLSVLPAEPAEGFPERATVWVADQYRAEFVSLFEDYLEDTKTGKPKNNGLVANIARIRSTLLRDLWQSSGDPPQGSSTWWEVWLRRTDNGPQLLRNFADSLGLAASPRVLRLMDRDVMWIQARWDQLEILPVSAVPVAEVRRPEFVDTVEDLAAEEQVEYLDDLVQRLQPAEAHQPAVCHLDTGVARTHVLLEKSLSPEDLQTVLGIGGFDVEGHGTAMAGIALFGLGLDGHLTGSDPVVLRHRLESVRIKPTRSEPQHDPLAFGDVTAQAVALAEATSVRRRAFCLPVTATGDSPGTPGQPTLWSATIDALAVGSDVVRDGDELQLLAPPDGSAARLILVSAGNVDRFVVEHLNESDTSLVQDPAQAWNALTIGAHTDIVDVPADPAYAGWNAVAAGGELSPYSRTSLLFGLGPWPIKPDIVMEGGNVLSDGSSLFEPSHPALSVRTTGHVNDQALSSANATSAATAQASRLAALAMVTYPEYWPETVRALLVHAAEWTPVMRQALDAAGRLGLKQKQLMLRRYGWGVPSEQRVLYSSDQAVTLVIQDEFVPFEGDDFKVPVFRLHEVPWPREVLEGLGSTGVDLRVTLSYFIEPTASRRGWRQRYKYPSHSLRFELQDPLESDEPFVQRVNRDAGAEDGGGRRAPSQVRWLVGANQRNLGSLHQDVWETSGVELSQSGKIAVYPVGGWWKYSKARDRVNRAVRYALVLSLRTPKSGIDLYTPIANVLRIPIEVPIE